LRIVEIEVFEAVTGAGVRCEGAAGAPMIAFRFRPIPGARPDLFSAWRQLFAADLEDQLATIRHLAIHEHLTKRERSIVDQMRERLARLSVEGDAR
jgi:hypothetical protein